jgi:sortase (surface protein transpeptidase)
LIRLVTLLLGALLIGGCSTPGPDAPSGSTGITVSSAPAPAVRPATIRIPKIGVMSTLTELGLTEAGELAVPPVDDPGQAGYYAGLDPEFDGDEIMPGERGPAVVAGHVDGIVNGRKGQPGVFARLHELVPGDEVQIERDDGVTLRFAVYAVERHAKDAFPTDRVYAATVEPELRLITCGGAFDRGSGHYIDNWIVWARLVP